MTSMQAYLADTGQRSRDERRRYAETTDRDGLLKYLSSSPIFPGSVRRAAIWASADQLNPEASLELLQAFWNEYRQAMKDGRKHIGFHGLLSLYEARKELSAVVWMYRNQRASVNAQRGMNDFLNGLGAE